MEWWLYSKIRWSSPDEKHFEVEMWPDRGKFPEYGYFIQPPQKEDVKKWAANEIIKAIFERAENFQGTKLDFRIGKD